MFADIFVPTIKLGQELAERMRSKNISSTVMMGRLNADVACIKKELILALRERGIHEGPSTCALKLRDGTLITCEMWHGCPYVQQFSDAVWTQVVVRTHAALMAPPSLPESLKLLERRTPRLTVVDESPLSEMIETGKYTVAEIEEAGKDYPILDRVLRYLQHGRDPAEVWKRNREIKEDLNETLDHMLAEREVPAIMPGDSESYGLEILKRFTPSPLPIGPESCPESR